MKPRKFEPRPAHITSLHVRNYRLLEDVYLPLPDLPHPGLSVLIGANASGKTSLLDVFLLLRDAVRGDLRGALSRRGGLDSVLTQAHPGRARPEWVEIGLGFRTPVGGMGGRLRDRSLLYRVEIERDVTGHRIRKEQLGETAALNRDLLRWIQTSRGRRTVREWERPGAAEPWTYDEPELVLPKIHLSVPVPHSLCEALRSIAHFGPLAVGPGSPIASPQVLSPSDLHPGPQGENLVAVLHNLRSHAPDEYERILGAIRPCYPTFRGLEFPLVADGRATLRWLDETFANGFDAHQLSEGTLRFLWLATALLSPWRPSILLLDEPEVSMHPELQMVLAGVIRESSHKSQVLVATHSPQLMKHFQKQDIVVFDCEESGLRVRRGDDPDLRVDEWLKDFTLDELWGMGPLGGRP